MNEIAISHRVLKRRSVELIIALLLIPTLVFAQQPQSQRPSTPQRDPVQQDPPRRDRDSDYRPSNVLVNPDDDYKIGAGDVIDIKVADADELSGIYRVAADGTIKLRFLGRIVALNKTPDQLTKTIADGLQGKYLFDPRVDIIVREYNSRMIYIQGAVSRPGVYNVEGRPDLMQMLVLAGGLLPTHGSTAYIIRRVKVPAGEIKVQEAAFKGESKAEAQNPTAAAEKGDRPKLNDSEWLARQYTLLKLNINGLFKGRFDQNMFLEPGDIVNIMSTEVFFVSGQVKAPGSFQLKDGTTLRQAIALAQSFTPTASPGKGIIFRENPETGKRLELPVDMEAVMKGKKDDVIIYPNDIIVVPSSGFKTFAVPLLQTATALVLTTLLLQVFE